MEGLFHSRYVLINRILSNSTANKIQEVQVEFLPQSQVLYKLKSCQQVPTNWKTKNHVDDRNECLGDNLPMSFIDLSTCHEPLKKKRNSDTCPFNH